MRRLRSRRPDPRSPRPRSPRRPTGADPSPGDPAYTARDAQNIADAYGRITGPGGQLQNPAYLPALVQASHRRRASTQLLTQVASPNHPAVTPGNLVPGWNVGNPLRAGWNGTRGVAEQVAFTNGTARCCAAPSTSRCRTRATPTRASVAPRRSPGVVVTEGSVQGSEGMYEWLAEDLAERGYVVLTYDVQGQGTSETFPHQDGPVAGFPFCDPTATPAPGEMTGCPGVPSQQLSNFVVGTEAALDFFTSRRNPFRGAFDRSPDRHPFTPGRTTRIAIVGHSMGAAAVSKVQGTDDRVATVVALDKLTGPGSSGALDGSGNVPTVPALAVQSEYGFTVTPWFMSGGSSLTPAAAARTARTRCASGPPGTTRGAGRASTRCSSYPGRRRTWSTPTSRSCCRPAATARTSPASTCSAGWPLPQAPPARPLLARSFRYLEPVGNDEWKPVRLHRDQLLSFYYCSAYGFHTGGAAHRGWRHHPRRLLRSAILPV